MNSIQTSTADQAAGRTGVAGTAATPGDGPWQGVDDAALGQQAELISLLQGIARPSSKSAKASDASGATPTASSAGPTAPSLEPPGDFQLGGDVSLLVTALIRQSINASTRANMTELDAEKMRVDASNKSQTEQLQKWVDAAQKAEHKGLFSKILGWVGKIAAVVGAAVATALAGAATVLTAGAATPLLVMTSLAFGAASLSMADQISRANGGGGVSLAAGISDLASDALQKLGVSKEEAEKLSKVVTGLVACACPALIVMDPSTLGDLAGGIAALAGASKETVDKINMIATVAVAIVSAIVMAAATFGTGATAAAGTMANTLATVGSRLESVNQVAQGVVSTSKAGVDMSIAGDQRDASVAKADGAKQAANTRYLQQQFDNLLSEMRKLLANLTQVSSVQGAHLAGERLAGLTIANNIGPSA